MKRPPAFQFYPKDFMGDMNVALMSLEERGAYITLMCFCWSEGSLPADVSRLSRLCGVPVETMEDLWEHVGPCFEERDGKLIHPRLEREREKQIAYREKKSSAGRKGAEERWRKERERQEQEEDDGTGNGGASGGATDSPKANDGPTSASSSGTASSFPEKETTPPKPPENSAGVDNSDQGDDLTTTGHVCEAMNRWLGLGTWYESEIDDRYNELRKFVRKYYLASDVSLEKVVQAVEGIRLLVDQDGKPEWLADRKGKPFDGPGLLVKKGVVPVGDGDSATSLFAAGVRKWDEVHREQKTVERTRDGPTRVKASIPNPEQPGYAA